jgi:hypothetical protein
VSDFRVVGAGEVADEIVARLAGTQIPAEIGEWVRKETQGGERWGQSLIGYSPTALCLAHKLKPDGRIILQLLDCTNSPVWEIILRPVES